MLTSACPFLQHRVAQVIAADLFVVSRPADPQIGILRPVLQQVPEAFAEQAVRGRLQFEAGGEATYPDSFTVGRVLLQNGRSQ